MTKKLGRPKKQVIKYSKRQIANIKAKLNDYALSNECPTLVDFLSHYTPNSKPISRKWVEAREDFAPLLEFMVLKEEAWLIEKKKEIPMAIFRLKQPKFGYVDTPKAGTEVNITFTNSVPRPKRKVIKADISPK